MKKLLSLVLALALVGGGFAFADVQLDKGQSLSTSPKVWFVGRYARTGSEERGGATHISADSVVIWDTTSNDGVTINKTTTSGDALVVGVTMDRIQGSSRDTAATSDEAGGNWGRIQTWGRHANVRFQVAAGLFVPAAGMRVGSGSTSQDAAIFRDTSTDNTANGNFTNSSKDAFGVLLNTPTSTATTADIFIKNM